jgi:hypothetical protein
MYNQEEDGQNHQLAMEILVPSYSLLAEQPMDSYTLQQVRRVRPVPSIDGIHASCTEIPLY